MAKFASGKYRLKNPEKYMGKTTPTYRSSWEFTFMKFVDTNPNIVKWASEAIRIPYRNPITNKNTIYVPDFMIVYVDKKGKQKTEMIEIKPANQSYKESVGKNKNNQYQYVLNKAKWQAADMWCRSKGIKFRVVTEKEMFR